MARRNRERNRDTERVCHEIPPRIARRFNPDEYITRQMSRNGRTTGIKTRVKRLSLASGSYNPWTSIFRNVWLPVAVSILLPVTLFKARTGECRWTYATVLKGIEYWKKRRDAFLGLMTLTRWSFWWSWKPLRARLISCGVKYCWSLVRRLVSMSFNWVTFQHLASVTYLPCLEV